MSDFDITRLLASFGLLLFLFIFDDSNTDSCSVSEQLDWGERFNLPKLLHGESDKLFNRNETQSNVGEGVSILLQQGRSKVDNWGGGGG